MADFNVTRLESRRDSVKFEVSLSGRTRTATVSGCAVMALSSEGMQAEVDYQVMRAVKMLRQEIAHEARI